MRRKLLTLLATGAVGLTVGSGIGIAVAASPESTTKTPPVTAECNARHASMSGAMTDQMGTAHMGDAGDMDAMHASMSGSSMSGSMSGQHARHHG